MPSPTLKQFEALQLQVEELGYQVEALTRELQEHGLEVPDIEHGKKKLSPEARLAGQRRRAAQARAAKQVGKGKGRISAKAKAQAKRHPDLRKKS